MEKEVKEQVNESELLKFQRSLSKQFMAVIDEENSNESQNSEVEVDKLGIALDYKNVQLFLELENLKTISAQNNYENSLRSKSWLLGFNQERGDVYTIYELEKAMQLVTTGVADYDIVDNRDKQVIYLKDLNANKQAFFLKLDNNSLQYTAGFTPVFIRNDTSDKFSWEISEDIEFESFILKENMSDFEWKVLNFLRAKVDNNEEFSKGEFLLVEPHVLFAQMVKNVYLDDMGVRPIFVLDIENFTKYLSTVSPF